MLFPMLKLLRECGPRPRVPVCLELAMTLVHLGKALDTYRSRQIQAPRGIEAHGYNKSERVGGLDLHSHSALEDECLITIQLRPLL